MRSVGQVSLLCQAVTGVMQDHNLSFKPQEEPCYCWKLEHCKGGHRENSMGSLVFIAGLQRDNRTSFTEGELMVD